MAKQKQHVFSARTTEEGLKLLNNLKAEKGISWDDLVVDAMCAHYGLDRLAMALPKAYRPEKPARKAEPAGQAAVESKGTDAGPAKAAKRDKKKNGGKEKHGKANTATQQATDEATGD